MYDHFCLAAFALAHKSLNLVKHSLGVLPSTFSAIWIHLSLAATDVGISFMPASNIFCCA